VALFTVAGIDAWWQTGFVFIVLSASLGALPEDCFEAARVDGASPAQTFWRITLPLLRPAVLTVAAIRMVDCLKVFALIYGTTDGGPQDATEVTQILVYRRAFKEFAMSESMTMMIIYSVVVTAVLATAYLIFRHWGRRDVGAAL
jgi:ABC-type sugar transport system permease subunit